MLAPERRGTCATTAPGSIASVRTAARSSPDQPRRRSARVTTSTMAPRVLDGALRSSTLQSALPAPVLPRQRKAHHQQPAPQLQQRLLPPPSGSSIGQ